MLSSLIQSCYCGCISSFWVTHLAGVKMSESYVGWEVKCPRGSCGVTNTNESFECPNCGNKRIVATVAISTYLEPRSFKCIDCLCYVNRVPCVSCGADLAAIIKTGLRNQSALRQLSLAWLGFTESQIRKHRQANTAITLLGIIVSGLFIVLVIAAGWALFIYEP